jgi:hypothetical protein
MAASCSAPQGSSVALEGFAGLDGFGGSGEQTVRPREAFPRNDVRLVPTIRLGQTARIEPGGTFLRDLRHCRRAAGPGIRPDRYRIRDEWP